MPKRKHDDSKDDDAASGKSFRHGSRQERQFAATINDGKTALFRALKLARGFERQKLGRREKSAQAKSDDADLRRLIVEVATLKKLDLADLADGYLCRYLVKTKAVAEHPALPKDVLDKATQPQPRDAAYLNVTGRLYKANPVVEALNEVMGKVRKSLALRDEIQPKKRLRKADYEAVKANSAKGASEPLESEEDLKSDPLSASASRRETQDTDDDESFTGFSDPVAGDNFHTDPVSEEGKDIDFSQFDSRLASSSEGDDEDASEGEDGLDRHRLYDRNRLGKRDMSSTSSASPVSPSGVSISSPALPEPPLRRANALRPVNVKQTTFLPSLASGYISGSESEASELSATAPRRRNRMSQRARREQAERKYGANARHLQQEGKSPKNRDKGWDPRRGAQDSGASNKWSRDRKPGTRAQQDGVVGGFRRNDTRSDRPSEKEAIPEKIPTYGTKHPSWIAKQKAKLAAAALRPAGKKTTFD